VLNGIENAKRQGQVWQKAVLQRCSEKQIIGQLGCVMAGSSRNIVGIREVDDDGRLVRACSPD
jgi:hypothetical protein